MKQFAHTIIKLRVVIILAVCILTLFFIYGTTRLTINSDITSYLKPDDPAMKLFNRIGEEYGGNQMVMIAITSEDIITAYTLNFIKKLTELYTQIDGVSSVTSLVNIIDIKDTPFGIEIGKLIDMNNIPQNEQELQELKKYILSKDIYRGKVLSKDSTATIIICKLNPDYNKFNLAKKIKDTTETQKASYRVYYSGYPIQMFEMSGLLLSDLKKLIPLVFVVVILVLFFSFKTIRGVFLPLIVVVISTIWTLGLMGYTNTPLSLISNVVPVILLAIGTAYGIHLLSKYYEDVLSEEHKISEIKKAVSEVGIPILLAGITTITGFLSFAGAYITAITEFGIFTAFGVGVAMILSITLLPAVLSFLSAGKNAERLKKKHVFKLFMERMALFVLKNKRPILLLSITIAVISVTIIPCIRLETSLINFFPKGSEIKRADKVIRENFGGSIPVQIVINGDLKNPHILKKMKKLEKYIDVIPHISNPQSIADLICRMNDIINQHETIPETKREVANLLFLLEGEEILDQLVNKDYSEGIIQATFGTEDSKIISNTISRISDYIQEELHQTFYVVSKDETSSATKEILKEWLLKQVSRSVYYDYKYYHPNGIITVSDIYERLKNINPFDDVLITPEIQQDLYKELLVFFEEESPVFIESGNVIASIVSTLLGHVKTESPTVESITSILKKEIPEQYWTHDPGSILLTAEFLLTKLKGAQKESTVEEMSDQLIRALFNEISSNFEFRKKVKDDLWELTENEMSVPSTLVKTTERAQEIFSLKAELSGMIRIVNRLNVSLRKSQAQSIIIAIVVVFILLAVQFKSLKMGIVSLSPIILVILLNFGIMGYAKIPLDYATMLVGSILIGVGIDYSIHFASRFRLEYRKSPDEQKSLKKTLGTTGIAIFINALMVSLGFFVLIAGNFVPVKREGWMIGLLMLISAGAALIFLPSLILVLRKLPLNTK
jgi:predicted RND superfamily exporter protein